LIPMVLFRRRQLPVWAIFTVPNSETLKRGKSVQPNRNRSAPSPLPLPPAPLKPRGTSLGSQTNWDESHLGEAQLWTKRNEEGASTGEAPTDPTAGVLTRAERGTVPLETARELLRLTGLPIWEQPQPEGKQLWAAAGQGKTSRSPLQSKYSGQAGMREQGTLQSRGLRNQI